MDKDVDRAIFASGCFWGTEHYMGRAPGVIATVVGYIGGTTKNPTYQQVCSGETGHAEAVEVVFRPSEISYEELAILFFETHDPTQLNRQGPDTGTQYRSEIFYLSEEQKLIARELISRLKEKGLAVVTRLSPATEFWKAEAYHQDYFEKNGQSPYCHVYESRF